MIALGATVSAPASADPAAAGSAATVAAPPGALPAAGKPPRPVKRADTSTLLPQQLSAAGWGPTGINTADNRQLLLAWNDAYWGIDPPPIGYTGNVFTCTPGTTSADFRLAELETINALRGIAGVGPVAEDAAWSAAAQQAALVVTALGAVVPVEPGDPCYTATAADAMARSAAGLIPGPQQINWYVEEFQNVASMQDRQLVLAPGVTKVGFGDTPDANVTMLRSAPGVTHNIGTTRNGFVAWPNAGRVPFWLADYWAFLDIFSFQLSTPEVTSNSWVTIKSSNGQDVSTTGVFAPSTTMLSFMPIRKPVVGETWRVTINQVYNPGTGNFRNIAYDIVFTGHTFSTPLVIAAYRGFLARTPSQGESDFQSGALWNRQVTREGFLRSLANSPERLSTIVRKMYLDTLGREPDPAGLANWVDWIRTGRFTVAQAASLFYSSEEFYIGLGGNTLTTWVTKLYEKLLNRAPDPSGLQFWVAYAANPAYGRSWVAGQFYQSLESRLTRVANLYQELLGRAPDPSGWQFWANIILTKGDIELAVSLSMSEEFFLRSWDQYS